MEEKSPKKSSVVSSILRASLPLSVALPSQTTHPRSFGADSFHLLNLMQFLLHVALINIDSVDPQDAIFVA
jgi:hypothetical protein